jgi:hypothetical protein
MNEDMQQRFVDHPAPSVGLFSLMLGSIGLVLFALIMVAAAPKGELPTGGVIGVYSILGASLAMMCFYVWPLYTTYYIVDRTGITVKYGPWTRVLRWEAFRTVYWQKGMFITKIGMPSINPCVRLSNGLLLPKKNKVLGLYITPNDPRVFIEKITLFAPELTKEMMV